MTNYELTITARHQADILERILRVTRHRGFRVQSMQMLPSEADPQQCQVFLSLSSERKLHLLTGQLDKLFDVLKIENSASQCAPLKQSALA